MGCPGAIQQVSTVAQKESLRFGASQNSQTGRLVGQECEEKILRTQARLDLGVRGRQAPSAEMIRDPVYLKTELGSDVGLGRSFCP